MSEPYIAIIGGSIIDGTGKPPLKNGVIVTTGSKINAVGPREEVSIPEGAEVIDAKGRTVMPGFIDCHTHFILMGVRTLTTLDLSKTKSLSEVLVLIKESIPELP